MKTKDYLIGTAALTLPMILGLSINNIYTNVDNQLVFIFTMGFYMVSLMLLFGYILSVKPRE